MLCHINWMTPGVITLTFPVTSREAKADSRRTSDPADGNRQRLRRAGTCRLWRTADFGPQEPKLVQELTCAAQK